MTDLQPLGALMRALVSKMATPKDLVPEWMTRRALSGRTDPAHLVAQTIAILGALTEHLGQLGISPSGRAYAALAERLTMDLAEYSIRNLVSTVPVIDAAVLYVAPGPLSTGPTRESLLCAAQRLADTRSEVEKTLRARQ